MSMEENKALLPRYLEFCNTGDVKIVDEIVAGNFFFTDLAETRWA